MPKGSLWRNVNREGERLDLDTHAPVLPSPWGDNGGETSSLVNWSDEVMVVCRDTNYEGQRGRVRPRSYIADLHSQGWGDDIESVYFVGGLRHLKDGGKDVDELSSEPLAEGESLPRDAQ